MQGNKNRTVRVLSDDFAGGSSLEEEELEMLPAELSYFLLSHKALLFHCL